MRSFAGRHFVADRHRAGYRQSRTAPISKKIERRLCAHFGLSHHVRENFRWRLSAFLSAKTEDGDHRDRAKDKNDEESAEHI
jgi:hypothetical protein